MINTVKAYIIYCLLVFLPATAGSHMNQVDILSSYFIPTIDVAAMPKIAGKFEVVRRATDGFEVIVPQKESNHLKTLAPHARLILSDIAAQMPVIKDFAAAGEGGYRTYDSLMEELEGLAESYPDLVQVMVYGRSAQGHPLFAVKVSDNVQQDEAEPELMITAATHGDEIITTEILVNLMEEMLAGYGENARFTNMVDGHEMFFIPVFNPDGFVRRTRYDNNVDPNRSYPYPDDPDARPTASVAGAIQFFHSRDIAGSLDIHAYGELVMYPWAYTYDSVPEKDRVVMDALGRRMAEINGYTYGPISKVIYVAPGSSADYYYWKNGTIAMAVEVGTSKSPNPRMIPAYTKAQAESLWRFIENF